jgi:hypothetical protein
MERVRQLVGRYRERPGPHGATRRGRETGQGELRHPCPGGLRAKMDYTVECTAVFKGETKMMLISVTGVHGDRVSFDYGLTK